MKETLQFLLPVLTNLLRYFIFAGLAFIIFYTLFPNKFVKNKIQSKFAKRKDFVQEVFHSSFSSIIIGLVIAVSLFTPLRDYTALYSDANAYPVIWIPISILLALFLHDTYFYWIHRWMHQPNIYKRVHLVHHKSTNPSPLASFSFHFFEAFVEALIVPLIILCMPMHIGALVTFGFLSFIINVYGHLGYEIAPKWFRRSFLFEILNTSVHHNLHHEKFHGNYGLYFRIWDRLMKTENPNYVQAYDAIQAKRFGLKKSKIIG